MIKRDETGKNILYYFLGYTNEIQLPNPDLALYNSPSLTFTLIERDGGHRSSISRRNSRRSEQEEQVAQAARATQAAQPAPSASPAQHTPPSAMLGMGWTPAIPAPGLTPGYGYGMGYVPHTYEAGGLSWQAGGSSWQAHGGVGPSDPEACGVGGSRHHEPGHSSDSKGMAPPVRPQVTLDVLNTRMGGLELQNRLIQDTLNAHI